jgi:hypothetical protein
MRASFAAIATLAVVLFSAPLQARDVLRPIAECEQNEWEYVCDVWGLEWYGPAAKAPVRKRIDGKRVIKTFLLTGSLNGGPPKPYALRFSQPLSDYFALTARSGLIAFMLNGEGKTIVRTNKGDLHILSKFKVERVPNVVVIDSRSWNAVARYYSTCLDLTFLSRASRIWDEGRGRCVSLDGRTDTLATDCARPKKGTCSLGRVPRGFERTSIPYEKIAALRDMRRLGLATFNGGFEYGGSGWGVYVYRVKGRRLLVLSGDCSDCY